MVEPEKQKVYILFSFWEAGDPHQLEAVFSSVEKAVSAKDALEKDNPAYAPYYEAKTYYIETEEVR